MRFTCIACSLQHYVQLHMCIILCLTSEILSFIINKKKINKLINQFVLSPMLTAIMYVSTGTLDIERILNVSIQSTCSTCSIHQHVHYTHPRSSLNRHV